MGRTYGPWMICTGVEPFYFDWRRGSAIRNDQWKLVREGDGEDSWELYDMTSDRTETVDLINKHKAVAEDLRVKWRKWAERVGIEKMTCGPEQDANIYISQFSINYQYYY